ncbi:hypothetical protein YQE_08806, partial [Dendroctonus ponderosae]
MSDKDYAPLSAACVRALNDKFYEKRKTAALEIEKMVKEFAAVNNTGQIKRILKILGHDFALSQNPHARKGGLIGLAAIALALGKETDGYTEDLIKPILGCFSDQDLRVRYYACESMYNVVKVARSAVLPHFSPIFNALSKVATDSDQNTKSASELLDRLLKDIVTESTSFDLDAFVSLLRERIYTRSPFSRQFIISWISVLNSEPQLDLINYLPEILDGLFRILEDTNLEVKKMCETTLGEFLRNIKSEPSRVNFGAMINILINHAQEKSDELVQFTAITWIKEFVQLSGRPMLPYISGIFTAILPCLAYETDARRMTDIKETASAVNFTLMKLISLQNSDATNEDHAEVRPNDFEDGIPQEIDLQSVVDVLIQYLLHNSIQTKVAVLQWIHHLYTKLPSKMVNYIDLLFPALQKTLSDEADQVVQQCLIVIAEVISAPTSPSPGTKGKNIYYNKFIVSLLLLFSNDKRLLDERGSFIIRQVLASKSKPRAKDGSFFRQLCLLLNAEDIYITLAMILLNETNLKFASLMVDHLNMILLTSSELFELRNRLKDLSNEKNRELFLRIYETWCHNPVATVALCLLTQSYSHVCDLIKLLYPFNNDHDKTYGSIEVTVDFLMEIDKLVQLIESPIFAYLRLELLEVPCDKHLVRALYGLLMLLPQTEAFVILKTRLSCIPSLHLQFDDKVVVRKKSSDVDFQKLLAHFKEVQEKHKHYKKENRTKEILLFDREAPSDDTAIYILLLTDLSIWNYLKKMVDAAIMRRKSQMFLTNISPVYDTHDEVIRKKLKRGKFPPTKTGIIKMISLSLQIGSIAGWAVLDKNCDNLGISYSNLGSTCMGFAIQLLLFLWFSFGKTVKDPGFWINLDIAVNMVISLVTILTSIISIKICKVTDVQHLTAALSTAGACVSVCGCAALFLMYRFIEEPDPEQAAPKSIRPDPRKSLFA